MDPRKAAFIVALVSAIGIFGIAKANAATLYVSPTGQDGPCTQADPCRTLERADSVAQANDIVRIAPGTYGAQGQTTSLNSSGVKWIGQAPKPLLRGKYRLSGYAIRLSRVVIDGPTGDVGGNVGCSAHPGESVLIDLDDGSNLRLDHSEIRNSLGNAGVYVSAEGRAISVDHNLIHDNGGFGDCGSSYENGQHGIYWHSGAGHVKNNVILHNWTRGVQLYSRPSNVIVKHNTIIWNGRAGVIHDTEGGFNVVANNIVAGNAWNGQGGIYHRNGGAPIVTNNLLWHNSDDLIDTGCANCITADPLFVGASIDNPPAPLDHFRRWTQAEATVNLHLSAASPAINAATASYRVVTDYDNFVRGNPADIGAYEWR
jgi:hypothetical protein